MYQTLTARTALLFEREGHSVEATIEAVKIAETVCGHLNAVNAQAKRAHKTAFIALLTSGFSSIIAVAALTLSGF